uniref:Macaca fascicularis brain cDNA clone: QtrA-18626, similar to human secretory carrier membrane protein 1 (SCAMP1),transcript variant 2, mRNA, RefSeq: NM_052822.2 n=1 Tax=Macaca fascicularis TaxID=9541 RepID=I7GA02_MACFA|nr:unnamed protein product [Macaca fascicularis]
MVFTFDLFGILLTSGILGRHFFYSSAYEFKAVFVNISNQ